MPYVVPPDDENPFHYWLRFEFGQSGNPHAHGIAYVNGNPQFDLIAANQEAYEAFKKNNHPDLKEIRLAEDAEKDVADFYDPYVREMHPCKDTAGNSLWNFEEPLYTLLVENVKMPGMAKPQTVNLLELLEDIFHDCDDKKGTQEQAPEPDTSKLKHLLLALIENGQRHDYHQHDPPTLGKHACARKRKMPTGKEYIYCRYFHKQNWNVS